MQRGWDKDLEFEFVRKDGTLLPVLLNATAIRDGDGNYLMSRTTVFDITARKRAELALLASERHTGNFWVICRSASWSTTLMARSVISTRWHRRFSS